jgi:Xaa-Pro aminopeptidase
VLKAIKPGMKDFEVAALAQYASQLRGSEDGIYLGSSAPLGQPTGILRRRHFQGREIKSGDYFTLLIENNGPGGFYTELGRTIVLGKAPQELRDELALILEAQKNTLRQLKPGARCSEIYKNHCAYMASVNRPGETRLYAHAQGYDLVERPLIRDDETMTIREGMNLAVHPGHATQSYYVWICDNYLITREGPSACLHKTPQQIFEVG